MEKRIIDVWMQHPSKAFFADPMFDSLRRWAHGGLPDADIPLEATIGAMDEAGVGVGLLAACVRRYPERLIGVASVDLHRPMEAIRELRRCVHQLGFRALRIIPWLWD